MEQILIRNLPEGTKAALRARAQEHHRSLEAEVRQVLADAVAARAATLVDLITMDEGLEIEFEPPRLGLTARSTDL